MKAKKIVESTTNRREFNRAYKNYLAHKKNGIHCSYCKYHRGENKTTKWYGGFTDDDKEKISYPNWKLVSKNRKQWMKKEIKLSEEKLTRISNKKYIDITW
ncbi:MAG: hypothetical protein PF487_10795 [Bacteroidales bacterium]|jgi:hypothetical protein|nr:hypothetical protein [Bacteroidales bacterium]